MPKIYWNFANSLLVQPFSNHPSYKLSFEPIGLKDMSMAEPRCHCRAVRPVAAPTKC